jgi:hypothetical protein
MAPSEPATGSVYSPPPTPPDSAAPARARAAELEREVADLQARLRRQVLALEDEQTSAEARQPSAERIAELRRDLVDRQAALAKLADETPPAPPDPAAVRELLATLPLRGRTCALCPPSGCASCWRACT